MPVPSKVLSAVYLIVLIVIPLSAVPFEANRVQLTLDTIEAD
jgi:hypothetical protein